MLTSSCCDLLKNPDLTAPARLLRIAKDNHGPILLTRLFERNEMAALWTYSAQSMLDRAVFTSGVHSLENN